MPLSLSKGDTTTVSKGTVMGLHRALKEKGIRYHCSNNRVKLFELLSNTSREQTVANKNSLPHAHGKGTCTYVTTACFP